MEDRALRLTSQKKATKLSWEKFDKNRNRDWGLYGVSMGIHDLNLSIGGWIPKMVTTIAARSGVGKSALMHSFFGAGVVKRQNRRAEFLVLSWEMGVDRIIDREVCMRLGVTQGAFTQGAKLFGDKTVEAIKSVYKECSAYPIEYQTASTNIDVVEGLVRDFCERCDEKSKEEGVDIQPVVIIDYLQMLQTRGSKQKNYEIGDFVNGIKALANETGASFGMLAQLNRAADDKELPTRNNLAESKIIEDASDNLILLHRPEHVGQHFIVDPDTNLEVDAKGKMLLRVLKSRDYGIRDVLINCDIKYFRFWSQDMAWGQEFHHLYTQKGFWMDHFGFSKNDAKQMNLDQN